MELWLNRLLSIVKGIQRVTESWGERLNDMKDMIWANAVQEMIGPDGKLFFQVPA